MAFESNGQNGEDDYDDSFEEDFRPRGDVGDPELEDGEHVELLDKVLGSMDDEDFEDVFERPTATRQDTPPTTNSVVDLSNDEDSVQSPNTAVPEEQTEESPVLPASPEDVGAVTETQQTQPPSEEPKQVENSQPDPPGEEPKQVENSQPDPPGEEPKQVENSQPDPPGEAELKVERKTSGMAEEPQPVGKQLEEPGNVPEASKEPPPEEPAEVGNQQEPKEDGGPQSPAAEVPELSAPSPPNGSPQDRPEQEPKEAAKQPVAEEVKRESQPPEPKVEEAEEGTSVQAAKTEKSAEEREEVNKREVSTTVDQPVEEAGDQRDEAPADAEHAEEPAQEDERLPVPPPEKDRSRRGFRRNRIPRSGPGPGSFGTSRRLSGHPSTNSGPDAAFIIAPSSFDMATTRSKVGKAQRPNSTGSVDFWSAHGLPSKGQGVPAPEQRHLDWSKSPGPHVYTFREKLAVKLKSQVPGPGQYPVKRSLGASAHMLPCERRFWPGKSSFPGPGAYDVPRQTPRGIDALHSGWSMSSGPVRELKFTTIL